MNGCFDGFQTRLRSDPTILTMFAFTRRLLFLQGRRRSHWLWCFRACVSFCHSTVLLQSLASRFALYLSAQQALILTKQFVKISTLVGPLFRDTLEPIHVHLPLKTGKVIRIEVGWHDAIDEFFNLVNAEGFAVGQE